MVFRQFHRGIIWRVIVLGATIFGLAWAILQPGMHYSALLLAILSIAQTGFLINYATRPDRLAGQFLAQIADDDISEAIRRKQVPNTWPDLEILIHKMKEILGEKNRRLEKQQALLELILNSVNTGILLFNDQGRILLSNRFVHELTGQIPLNLDHLSPHDGFKEQIQNLPPGKTSVMMLQKNGKWRKYALRATAIKTDDEHQKLVSFTDIESELRNEEMDAWQKLIRVMTHEVMNSITPFSGISSSLMRLISHGGKLRDSSALEPEVTERIYEGLSLLEERGEALYQFVSKYRKLLVNKEVEPTHVDIGELTESMILLYHEQAQRSGIRMSANVPDNELDIETDREMLQQVLINIIKNAFEALEGGAGGKILLACGRHDDGTVWISIADNGPGIDPENRDKVFVPFFTTKPGGTGTGLSLSAQLMRVLNGSVDLQSTPAGTTVTLKI